MKEVGKSLRGSNLPCIGIASWGHISGKESLIPQTDNPEDKTFIYQAGSWSYSKGDFLDDNHTHFLLVDDGTEGRPGGEMTFRSKFEGYIMKHSDGMIINIITCLYTVL